jgi:hypothetical protein
LQLGRDTDNEYSIFVPSRRWFRISQRDADLLEIAAYVMSRSGVVAAEEGVQYAEKWHRVFVLKIMTSVLMRDREHLEEPSTFSPVIVTRSIHFARCRITNFKVEEPDDTKYKVNDVVLCSGGLDSFTGIVDEVIAHRNSIAMVSHWSNPKPKNLQKELTDYVHQPDGVMSAIQVR